MYRYRVLQNTPAELGPIWRLAHDVYSKEGYCDPQPDGLLRHYPHLDLIPHTRVIAAYDDTGLAGTNSLTLDSAAGLHTDSAFPWETKMERQSCLLTGLTLGSSWRIVTREPGVQLVLGLIGRSIDEAEDMGLDAVLFTFHPKHVRIYRHLLGLEAVTGPRDDPSVLANPAVLMRGDMMRIRQMWNRRVGA